MLVGTGVSRLAPCCLPGSSLGLPAVSKLVGMTGALPMAEPVNLSRPPSWAG